MKESLMRIAPRAVEKPPLACTASTFSTQTPASRRQANKLPVRSFMVSLERGTLLVFALASVRKNRVAIVTTGV
jgi:hypothetical protein